MNTLIVLSALVSAAFAVPHISYGSRHGDDYSRDVVYGKSYSEPTYVSHSAPVYQKSYSVPVLTKSYGGYGNDRYGNDGYGNEGYGNEGYGYGGHGHGGYGKTTGHSTQYFIKHVEQPKYTKSYAQPIHSAPMYKKSYSAPILAKSYHSEPRYVSHEAPVYAVPVAEPVYTKSAVLSDYGHGLDYEVRGYGKGY